MKARLLAACVAALAIPLAACSSSTPSGPDPNHTAPVVISSPFPYSFDLNALCAGLYHDKAPAAVGKGQLTGWSCENADHTVSHQITPGQMQAACSREHPGYVLVNLQEPNALRLANSKNRCMPPDSDPGIETDSHVPGTLDVSTMANGQRFYAVPNFRYLLGCGQRPCWLPIYTRPTHVSQLAVKRGWPCEAYVPSEGQYCLTPPAERTAAQQWDPYFTGSGDRLLVLCQAIGQPLNDETARSSGLWDGVAVPVSKLGIAAAKLKPIAGMPDYRLAYAPDIFLGDTGSHRLSRC